jgi:hypothetical protein
MLPTKWINNPTQEKRTIKVTKDDGTEAEEEEQYTQDHWEKLKLEGNLVKITPGITQFERRLSGPFHQLMQAYTAAFPKYKHTTFKAHWKSLVLTDPEGAWLGRVKYVRDTTSQASTAEWKCVIMLPQTHFSMILEAWKKNWYSQLKKQIEMTDTELETIEKAGELTATKYTAVQRFTRAMSRAKPQWDEHTEEGMEAWVARFKWEFPWKVEFEEVPQDSQERQAFADIPTVEQLMEEMASSQQAHQQDIPTDMTTVEAADPTGEKYKQRRAKRGAERTTEALHSSTAKGSMEQ